MNKLKLNDLIKKLKDNFMKNSFLALLMLLTVTWSYAQEQTYSFTLEEAINFAIENNYGAINADRDLLDAQKQKWETIATGLPQISGAVSYQNQLKQPVSLLPGELAGQEPGTFIPIVFSQPQTASATATLKQQIFDGSYIVGIQATKAFIAYSDNNKEKTELDVRKSVVEAYGNVLLSQESITILEKNKANLEKNLFETQKLFENGLGDEESVEQLQITLSSVENQLKNSLRLQSITLQMLNLIMGLDIDAPTQLKENLSDLAQAQIRLDLLNEDLVMDNNIDFKMVDNLNQQRELELKLQKSLALPTLNAFINYGSTSYSDRFNFLNNEAEWFDSSILGFDLSIPIFSSLGRSAKTARAKIALEKARTQKSETEQSIRLQHQTAKSNYLFSIEQYNTASENLALAERIEMKNEIKYSEGLATSFELRQAQTQLYDAQQEYLQSMVEVINNKTTLETVLNSKL
ncbi:outer membrane channel protein TolC [Arenibacter algicola]|jgi:outer membrane protein TolC|uniref:Outer membrane channel protein TolC n=2 Tax=Arenibacter algicola TaxID=616991 RepID=A0A221UUR4_9FLAO|nr:outer membrane channel protein TolC [Arenibacter algicola]|tara:strand:+ start:11105 stop:12496 length:1392 start_codon:yes stop_codon:yes gene_type:complete